MPGNFVCWQLSVHLTCRSFTGAYPKHHRRSGAVYRPDPGDAVGFVFLEGGKPVQPDPAALGTYQRHAGAPGGVWPSSPEISSAMLERYNKNQNGNDRKSYVSQSLPKGK